MRRPGSMRASCSRYFRHDLKLGAETRIGSSILHPDLMGDTAYQLHQ
jgi:hypothetical protein